MATEMIGNSPPCYHCQERCQKEKEEFVQQTSKFLCRNEKCPNVWKYFCDHWTDFHGHGLDRIKVLLEKMIE